MREHAIEAAGELVPESESASPPVVRCADTVAFCLIALVVLSIVTVLYVARGFFLPVVAAAILGTMLSPVAKRFEALRIPRPVSAALIVLLTWIAFVLMIGLISVPVVEWFDKLPELGPILKDKLHAFDRPLAIWQQLQVLLGSPEGAEQPFQFPKIAWVQPTIEFLSPTFTEILLFFAVLVLFIASWPDLRRALVMSFQNREARLRALVAPLAFAAFAFAAFAFVEGHFVTPAIIGRRLALNALAVFLALAFWTWLWGPMGAFLSSPPLIVGLIIKQQMLPESEQPLPLD